MYALPQYLDEDAVTAFAAQAGNALLTTLAAVSVLIAGIGVGMLVYNILFTNHKRALIGAAVAATGFVLATVQSLLTNNLTGGDSALTGACILSVIVAAGMGFSGMGSHNEQSFHN